MNALLRATVVSAMVVGIVSCAAAPDTSRSAKHEYSWALGHGGCDCGPVAYAPGVSAPYDGRDVVAEYVHAVAARCASRQFVVAVSGDGKSDVSADTDLAHARAAPFVRRLSGIAHRRIDTLVLVDPHIPHPSTLVIVCPTDRLPAQNTF